MSFPFLIETWFSGVLFALFVSLLFYWYFRSPNAYWEERGLPFIPAKPLIGSLSFFSKKQQHDIDVEYYKTFDGMYGIYEGKTPVLLISKHDMIKNVLIKDFQAFPGRRTVITGEPVNDSMVVNVTGENWKRLRCIISPAFSTGKIKKMTNIILSSAKTLGQNFIKMDGKPFLAKPLFSTFTMDVVASVAFATKIHSFQDPNNRFILEAKNIFQSGITWRLLAYVLIPDLAKFLRLSIFPPRSMKFFKDAVIEIIRHRKKTGTSRNDFLQLLLDVEKECQEQENEKNAVKEDQTIDDKNAVELGHEENNAQIFKIGKSNKYISPDEMVAQSVLFFLAGFDTVASTISLATYMLARNPKIQEKLSDEINTVIRSHNNKLTYEALQEMKYLDNVVTETLRLYPIATRVERVADVDYTFEGTGVTIKKGTVVAIPVYAMHHDPELYPEPEEFNPERFSPEEKASRHPYSFLTFGAGPRNCVAMRFALMEVKLCVAFLISQFHIKSCKETMEPLKLLSLAGVLQPTNIMYCVEVRQNRVFDGFSNDNSDE